MKGFTLRRLVLALCVPGLVTLSSESLAAAFQLFEQDGASPGNYHAGYAVAVRDASIAFYNPAGIPQIKNQQAVFAGMAVVTSFKYQGGITVSTIEDGALQPVTAQGGTFGFIPAFHYVAPITDYLGFGFSITVPFGLKTNYGYGTILRYAATKTGVTVIDFSPSLGWQITEKGSIGAGIDVQRMYAEFYSVGVMGSSETDSVSTNTFKDTGYGYHLGGLYQFTNTFSAGISYHSQVVHHLSGSSLFEGLLATEIAGGPYSSRASTNITLPPYTAVSINYQVKPYLALMSSIIYTQWSTIQSLVLNNISGLDATADKSQTIQIFIPEYYKDTINFSVGTEYNVSDKTIFRAGLGFDQSPVQDAYRNIELPDNNRYILALGGHYQASKTVGLDVSWLHIFFNQTPVNPPIQAMGGQKVTTPGQVSGGGDLYAAQVTWDIL